MKQLSIPFWTLLNAGYITVGTDWNYQQVCSPFTRLYYVTAGRAYIELSERSIILEPGRFYIVPAYTLHSNRCPHSMTHYYLHVFEESDGTGSSITDSYVFPDSLEPEESLAHLFRSVLSRNSGLSLVNTDPKHYDTHSSLRSQMSDNSTRPLAERIINNGFIQLLMGYWLNAGRERRLPQNSRIADVMDYVNRHLFEDFSLSDCAAAVSMSRYHLLRQFKAVMGTSLMNHVQFLRMRRAQADLVMTTKSIKEVAAGVGYDDTNYFIRLFRKQTGQTPGAYRRNNKV